MPTPEGKIKDAVKKALSLQGLVPFSDFIAGRAPAHVQGFYYMPVAGRFSVLGIHDFVGCWRGIFFSIETKAVDNPTDATFHQERFQYAVDAAGGISVTGARGPEVVEMVKALVDRRVSELGAEVTYGRHQVA